MQEHSSSDQEVASTQHRAGAKTSLFYFINAPSVSFVYDTDQDAHDYAVAQSAAPKNSVRSGPGNRDVWPSGACSGQARCKASLRLLRLARESGNTAPVRRASARSRLKAASLGGAWPFNPSLMTAGFGARSDKDCAQCRIPQAEVERLRRNGNGSPVQFKCAPLLEVSKIMKKWDNLPVLAVVGN